MTEDTLARVCDERDAAKADARMMAHLVVKLGKRVRQLEDDLVYRLEGLPLPETDYAELGYQETDWAISDLDSCAAVVLTLHRWFHSLTATDKENQDDVEKG